MLKNFPLLMALLTLSLPVSASADTGSYGCALIDRQGKTVAAVTFQLGFSNGEAVSIDFTHHHFSEDLFIYRRTDLEFVGDSVAIVPPPYLTFEEWRKQCATFPLPECTEENYLKDKAEYELRTPKVRLASDIAENDPDYFVVGSRVDSTLSAVTALKRIGDSETLPSFKHYESEIASSEARVLVSNEYDKNRVFLRWNARYRISLDYGPVSYILNVDQYVGSGALRRSYACNKK